MDLSDPMPSYFEFTKGFVNGISKYVERECMGNYSYPMDFLRDLRKYGEINYLEAVYGLLATIIVAIVRSGLTRFAYEVKHFEAKFYLL